MIHHQVVATSDEDELPVALGAAPERKSGETSGRDRNVPDASKTVAVGPYTRPVAGVSHQATAPGPVPTSTTGSCPTSVPSRR